MHNALCHHDIVSSNLRPHTDVYSFGYLMKVVSHRLNNRELSALYHLCKNVSPNNRPKMPEVEKALNNLLRR